MSSTETTESLPRLAQPPTLDRLAATVEDWAPAIERRPRTAHRPRGWLVRRALMWSDLLGLSLAFGLSELLYSGVPSDVNRLGGAAEYLIFFVTLPLWVVAAKLYGLYDRDESRANHTTADDIVGVFHLVTVVAWLLLAGAYVTGVASPAFVKVAIFWAIAIPGVTLARAGARTVCRRHPSYLQNTIVVGAGEVGQLVGRKILQHPEYGISLVGFVDDQPKEQDPRLVDVTLLGSPDYLAEIVTELDVERVIVAFSNDSHERTAELVRSLRDLDVQIDIVPRLFDLVSPATEIHTLEGIPLLAIPSLHLSRSSQLLKRTMDVVFAAAGLVLLAPLFAVIACLIRLDSPGPVFFSQTRIGSRGRRFRILKFRSMVYDAERQKAELYGLNMYAQPSGDARMFKLPDDPRATRLGRFLRRFSLDELPQLINVLRGDMSLVGPRPLVVDEDFHVRDWARSRLDLKPGMTGLWQVLGRSDIPFEEMVKLDYLYVTTWSLWQDFRLLLRTVPTVASGARGSY